MPLFNVAQYICCRDSTFTDYLYKKRGEGKYYYVVISHAVKKVVRDVFHLERAWLKAL